MCKYFTVNDTTSQKRQPFHEDGLVNDQEQKLLCNFEIRPFPREFYECCFLRTPIGFGVSVSRWRLCWDKSQLEKHAPVKSLLVGERTVHTKARILSFFFFVLVWTDLLTAARIIKKKKKHGPISLARFIFLSFNIFTAWSWNLRQGEMNNMKGNWISFGI